MQPNAFKLIKTLHIALLLGMFVFAMVSLVIVLKGASTLTSESFQLTFQVVCIVVSITCTLAGFNIFKRRILAARNSKQPADKRMEQYRTACITWWAMIEGPGLLAIIGFLLSGNFAFFTLGVVHILIMITFTPRKGNIILFLNLSSKEVAQLEGGKK
jgi:hypothetical protein